MYLPHIVTLYTVTEDPVTFEPLSNITVLKGVLLDESKGANVRASGLLGADAATLHIPRNVNATDGISLLPKSYLGPVGYRKAVDKSNYWTLDPGENATFFVKGEVVEPGRALSYIKLNYDSVYMVTKSDFKNFGTPDIQHWEVGGN